MAVQICLQEKRKAVDEKYVGFKPNGGSIKPVHIADGAFRSIVGSIADTKKIQKLAYVISSKGNTPKGNELDNVMEMLRKNGCIEEDIDKSDVESMRNIMQRLLGADNGVFYSKTGPVKDGMVSFTAGSRCFITHRADYEDAGEFIGTIIRDSCPELAEYIKQRMSTSKDPISLLFSPVLESEPSQVIEPKGYNDIPAFKNKNAAMGWYLKGISDGGNCLLESFKKGTNSLTHLRLFNFFCIFHLLRYLAMLEAFYCEDGSIRPILAEFSHNSQSSIARASTMSYTQMHRSISRFYAWGYAQELKTLSINELMQSETPVYTIGQKTSKTGRGELDELWALAKDEVRKCKDDETARLVFGTTIYDMLALEASSHPVNFLKFLGTQSGILYPPDNIHPNKRFYFAQDILEMLLRSCVQPNESISGKDLRTRLWERFGIIIGGSEFELQRLQENGMILQVDNDSLENNFMDFASKLESMDFAEIMADGILQIRLGGND